MSPDEIANLLDALADRIEAIVHNPDTHIPMDGETFARRLARVLRDAAAEVGSS